MLWSKEKKYANNYKKGYQNSFLKDKGLLQKGVRNENAIKSNKLINSSGKVDFKKAEIFNMLKDKGLLNDDFTRNNKLLKKFKLTNKDGNVNLEKLKKFKSISPSQKKVDYKNPAKFNPSEDGSNQVSKVVGSAKQVRNITIQNLTLHKGDMNVNAGDSYDEKTPEQIKETYLESLTGMMKLMEKGMA